MTRKSLHMILIFLGCQSINLSYALAVPCKDLETKCNSKWKPKEGNNESEAICKFLLKNKQMEKRPDILKECEELASGALVPPPIPPTTPCTVLVRELRSLVKGKYQGDYCVGEF